MSDLKPCPVCAGSVMMEIESVGAFNLEWLQCQNKGCGISLVRRYDAGLISSDRFTESYDEMFARWNALTSQCAHEWIAVSDGPNMPSHGECSKCGSRMGTVHG